MEWEIPITLGSKFLREGDARNIDYWMLLLGLGWVKEKAENALHNESWKKASKDKINEHFG